MVQDGHNRLTQPLKLLCVNGHVTALQPPFDQIFHRSVHTYLRQSHDDDVSSLKSFEKLSKTILLEQELGTIQSNPYVNILGT